MIRKQTMLLAGTAFAASFCLANIAKADVKIVQVVNVTGQMQFRGPQANPNQPAPPSAYPQTVTIYYKGADARLETSTGALVIFKGSADKVYTISTKLKEYYTKTFAEEAQPRFGGRGNFTIKTDVDVTPAASTNPANAKTLAGLSATLNTVSGTMTLPSFGGRGGRGGGQNGGGNNGAQPGGGQAGAAPTTATTLLGSAPQARLVQDAGAQPNTTTPPAAPPARVIKLDGEVWTSSSVVLPGDDGASAMPSLISLGQSFAQFLTPLTDSLTKAHQIPLDVKLSYTRPSRNPDATPTPIVGTITTKSVSTAALDASLFTIPADYAKVDAPAPPTFGGRGGQGGPGGGGQGNNGNGGAPPPPAASNN